MSSYRSKPELHMKGWGYEQWIANSELYCGKLLKFINGKQCSWHYHEDKTEHFFIQEGKLQIQFGFDDDITKATGMILYPGDVFKVPRGMRHRMRAMHGDCTMFEFSTQHFEEDSYRIEKGD